MDINFKCIINLVVGAIGSVLLLINIYGVFQNIQPKIIFYDELRFTNDASLTFEESMKNIRKNDVESIASYSERLTQIIAQRISHIHWERYENTKFNQLIPIWENYILYLMGIFSNIPEFEKYHFSNSERSMKRGIGICGDAAIIMSGFLKNEGIKHQIISFPGHVVVSVKTNKESYLTYDPDYGVAIPYSIKEINQNSKIISPYYIKKGYLDDITVLSELYSEPYMRWNGTEHFITKKYYFEIFSYILKWLLPILLILYSGKSFLIKGIYRSK